MTVNKYDYIYFPLTFSSYVHSFYKYDSRITKYSGSKVDAAGVMSLVLAILEGKVYQNKLKHSRCALYPEKILRPRALDVLHGVLIRHSLAKVGAAHCLTSSESQLPKIIIDKNESN